MFYASYVLKQIIYLYLLNVLLCWLRVYEVSDKTDKFLLN